LLVNGTERIGEERVLDVSEEQLLMLLFMIDAEFDAAKSFSICVGLKQAFEVAIDVVAVAEDLFKSGTGEGGAQLLFRERRKPFVVTIEEPGEVPVEKPIAREEGDEDEGLKEPGCVGEVPLGGRSVRRGLDHHVLGRKAGAELERAAAN